MNNSEIEQALTKDDRVSDEELDRRYELSVCEWDKEGNTSFVPAEETEKYIKDHIEENPDADKSSKKAYGTCAEVGRYTGTAKVVMSAMHATKVEDGDVLIAPMTSPDYVVGMKKAGAIVTDEGGITCHAAIVSRELKIPCVVGTGNATKLFKDGDTVTVNANHASVKLVE